ncbi:hypothetical protein E1286_40585 [Nonomuraea terrae]|uniref:Lipoprotein n=1 Tax=Nonomuraea terrae TaxID=2530383 RepID=A0A4V2YIF8_9ACTN|nr:hypothetical protein [Nonomuraea terrae]TDD34637.1 hypothetical protein E1286_40585 [Nonomuraea terrae]
MRRAIAIIALAGSLAGCSFPDTSILDEREKPVQQYAVFEVALVNAHAFFDLDVQWGYSGEEHKERVPGNTTVQRRVSLTWPDHTSVWAGGTPSKKPGVDDLLAYAQGEPIVRCSITINGRVVAKNDLTMCRYDFLWTPVPDPGGTAG